MTVQWPTLEVERQILELDYEGTPVPLERWTIRLHRSDGGSELLPSLYLTEEAARQAAYRLWGHYWRSVERHLESLRYGEVD